MSRMAALLSMVSIGLCLMAQAQQPPQPQKPGLYDSHYRIYAIIQGRDGRGTRDDPYRPTRLPNPKLKDAPGVKHLGWAAIPSLDRKSWFCEIVSEKSNDLAPITNDRSVRWWDKSAVSQALIQAELSKFNPKARIEQLRVMAK